MPRHSAHLRGDHSLGGEEFCESTDASRTRLSRTNPPLKQKLLTNCWWFGLLVWLLKDFPIYPPQEPGVRFPNHQLRHNRDKRHRAGRSKNWHPHLLQVNRSKCPVPPWEDQSCYPWPWNAKKKTYLNISNAVCEHRTDAMLAQNAC